MEDARGEGRFEEGCRGSDTAWALMHVCVAEYNALPDGEVAPEEKTGIMGDNQSINGGAVNSVVRRR
jgi:hypothetical protein